MMAADEWRKYQEDYIHYGVDLQPQKTRQKKEKEKPALKVSAHEKSVILMLILAVGICCIAVICMQACVSEINYNINSLNQEIDGLKGDIDNLNVKLQSQNNLSQIEYYATNNLMMVYPESEQHVDVNALRGTAEVNAYIASLTESQKGIAANNNVSVAAAARQLLSQA